MELYVILRRRGWSTQASLDHATVRARRVEDQEMPDQVRWIRTYVLEENEGSLGTICVFEASGLDAIRKHASLADLPADEIVRVLETVVLRADPDPEPAAA